MSGDMGKLSDVAKVQSGFAFKSRDWRGDGVPVIKIQNVRAGRVKLEGCSYVSDEVAVTASRYRLYRGDVLVTMSGEIGSVGVVRTDEHLLLNQRVGRIMLLDPDAAEIRYIAYALQDPCIKSMMEAIAYGAAQPNISPTLIGSLPLWLPPRATQTAIANVLEAFDDLIENNRRRLEVLDEMARAIYREWFVKFRYPGHEDVPMVDSALGLIPDGWEVQPLAAIATVNGSSRKPGGDEVFRYLDISALSERHIGELEAIGGSSAPGRARRVVSPGDTVWATVRPNRRAHALLVAPDSDWIASTGLAVLTPSTVSPDFLFETLSATAFSDWLVGRATGSAYPAVRAKDFEEAPIVVPDVAVDAAFADKVSPMHDLSWRLRNECSRLAALRDLLLPKLVTGQIDISTLDLDALVARQVA